MAQQHRIANLCDGSTERSLGLHDIYEDTDGSMREEVRSIISNSSNLFANPLHLSDFEGLDGAGRGRGVCDGGVVCTLSRFPPPFDDSLALPPSFLSLCCASLWLSSLACNY